VRRPAVAIPTAAEQVNVDHSEQLHRQLTFLGAPDCFGFGYDCARTIGNLLSRFDVLYQRVSPRKTQEKTRGTTMATRAKSATAEEITAIEDLISDLEKRLRRLSGSARREASGTSGDVGAFVSEALERITARVRESATEAGESLADEAANAGAEAFKKLSSEVEQRPWLMLAVAAGIGFLAGLANRR
jgi:ElaB/YqjD/DUF883 family membrane-anchored ribosome-binding protein